MSLISRKPNPVLDHLNRASQRKNSGIRTVTAAMRTQQPPRQDPPFGVPFGKLVFGPEAGTPQTAYKPILRLY
jgi:hypothetical protein